MRDQQAFHEKTETMRKRREFLRSSLVAVPAAAVAASTIFPSQALATAATILYFNVMDGTHAVHGDGLVDDTAGINLYIIDALNAGGGVVLLPAGTYRIDGTLSLINGTVNAVTLQGVGPGDVTFPGYVLPTGAARPQGTTLLASGTADTIVVQGNRATIRNLAIYSSSPRTSGRAIYLNGTRNALVEDVDMCNQLVCVEIRKGFWHRVNRCSWALGAGGIGLLMSGSLTPPVPPAPSDDDNDTFVSEVYVAGQPTAYGNVGFRIRHTGALTMTACSSLFCNFGLLVDPGQDQRVEWSFFTECAWDVSANNCIALWPSSNGIIQGINFTQCWSASTNASPGGDLCTIVGAVDGVQFTGHRFFNNPAGNGLYVVGPTPKHIYVDACIAAGIHGSGYCFVSGAKDFAVRNSHAGVYAAQAACNYGIFVDSGCTRYLISGCTLQGNTTAGLLDGGIAPKVVVAGSNLIV